MNSMGIKGYAPEVYASASEVAVRRGDLLRQLLGTRLQAIWGLRHVASAEWDGDPVARLVFDAGALEVGVWELDRILLSWNSIDVSVPLDAGGDQFEWTESPLAEHRLFLGRTLTGVRLIEYFSGVWLLNGIDFVFEGDRLSLVNGLDTLIIAVNPPEDPRHRYSPL